MTSGNEKILSNYKEIFAINKDHEIYLVQHVETNEYFVKKTTSVYNLEIYLELYHDPVDNIPAIHELIVDDGLLIIIEEYIEGETLQALLNKRGTLSDSEILAIMLQLTDTLEGLHARTPAIIHRDIKPSNIIMTVNDEIRLIDFNAAKYLNPDAEEDTTLLGTKGYAAPEQYGFGSSNTLTDIYAMGMLMNVMLTGVISRECKSSSPFSAIIQKCLQLDPANRYQSVSDLREELFNLPAFSEYAEPSPFIYGSNTADHHVSSPASAIHESPKEPAKSKDNSSWLPPGFRTRRPLNMIISVLGYLSIIYMSATMEILDTNGMPLTGIRLYNERFVVFLMLMVYVLLFSNYKNLQKIVPFASSKYRLVKYTCIFLMTTMINTIILTVMLIIEPLIPA